jgi:hypothetical protein
LKILEEEGERGEGTAWQGRRTEKRGQRTEVRRQSAERPVHGRMGRNKRTKEREDWDGHNRAEDGQDSLQSAHMRVH